jgi:hypothetical protein
MTLLMFHSVTTDAVILSAYSVVIWNLSVCLSFSVSQKKHTHRQKWKFKWINQLDAAINYRFIVCCLDTAQHVSDILMTIIRSLLTAAAASGLPKERGGSSAVGRGRPTARSYGKPEAAAAVDRLLMMGIRMPETCWALSKRQTINFCFQLIDSFECVKEDTRTYKPWKWKVTQIIVFQTHCFPPYWVLSSLKAGRQTDGQTDRRDLRFSHWRWWIVKTCEMLPFVVEYTSKDSVIFRVE